MNAADTDHIGLSPPFFKLCICYHRRDACTRRSDTCPVPRPTTFEEAETLKWRELAVRMARASELGIDAQGEYAKALRAIADEIDGEKE